MVRHRNIILFLILAAIWGGSYISIKAGLDYFPPVIFAAIRYDIAAIIMLAYVFSTHEYWYPRTRADWIATSIGSILIIAGYNYFIFIGEQMIPAAVAGILVGLNPVFATVLSRILLPEEQLGSLGVAGLVLGFVGIALIARPDPSNLLTDDIVGKLFVVMAAACLGGGSVLTQLPNDTQPVITLEAWSMTFGAVLLHFAAVVRPGETVAAIEWTGEVLLHLLYLAILSSAVAYFIYFDLLDRLGPIEINLIAYAAAAFGAVFGWLLLNERIDELTIFGFVLIFIGFILVKSYELRQELARISWIRDWTS